MNNRLYEARSKKKFMEGVKNDQTKAAYEWLFDKTFEFEQRFSKDLSRFSKEELLEYLKSRKMVESSLKVHLSYINTYINWMIENNLILSDRNNANQITDKELKSIARKHNLIHRDIILELIGVEGFETGLPKLKNYQDKLLIYLIFFGANGERAKELINLKFEHFDLENKTLRLSELDSDRKDIRLDNAGVELVKRAKEEEFYNRYVDEDKMYARNAESNYKVVNTDFVFRKSTAGKKSSDARLTYSALINRIGTISRYVGIPMTMGKLERSGIAYFGKGILDRGFELSVDSVYTEKLIYERYNITTEAQKYKVLAKAKKDIEDIYRDQS